MASTSSLTDVLVCSCVGAEACESNKDCPSSKPICFFEDSSSLIGLCAECTHSLDCRDDLLCSPSTFTCEPGPRIINSRCGPEDDNVRSYEVDVPLYTGVSKDGYLSYEISKWPVYVSSIRFDTSSEQSSERLNGSRGAGAHLVREVKDWALGRPSNQGKKEEADVSGLYTFVGGLTKDSEELAAQVGVDAGSYFVDGTRTEYPAIGKGVIISGSSPGRSLGLDDITRVRACIRRMDFDWQGNPMNPIAGRLRYEEEAAARSRSSSSRSTRDERYCEGYEKDGDAACPSGSKCTGKYYGATAGQTPNDPNYNDVGYVGACSGAVFEDGKCQVGDIKLEDRGFKCQSAFGNPWSPVLPLCGTCESSGPACTAEVLSATAVMKSYPSAAKSVSPSGAQVSSETTVSNAGDNEQSTTVSLQFTSTQTNVVTITTALANNIQANLKVSIPIPVLKPDGSITSGQTQTFTNQEAQTSTSTVQVSNTQTIKIPPKTKQTVIGKINTQNVRIEVPITVKVQYTCGKADEEIETTAEMTSDGTLLQGTTSFDISYGPTESLP